jgi:hypothetical protein
VLLVACVRSAASFHIDRVSKSFPACLSWQQHRLIPKPAIGCFPIFASAGPLVWCDSPLAAGRGTSSASVRLLRCERHGICFTTERRRECRRKLTAETSASPRVSQSVREAKADGTNWVGEMRREGLRECGWSFLANGDAPVAFCRGAWHRPCTMHQDRIGNLCNVWYVTVLFFILRLPGREYLRIIWFFWLFRATCNNKKASSI